jgi:hypothetical protein
MLLALIYVLIIVVIGAICFYPIDKFVRDGRLGNLLKILVVLFCLAAILQRLLPILGVNFQVFVSSAGSLGIFARSVRVGGRPWSLESASSQTWASCFKDTRASSAFPAVLAAGFPCLSVLTLTHKQLFYLAVATAHFAERKIRCPKA